MIWRPRPLTRRQHEERRLEAGRFPLAGALSHADITRRLGLSRIAVSTWAQHLRQHQGDMPSWHTRLIPGRPTRLHVEPWPRVLAVLTAGALKAGFDTDRWTLLRIRAVMLVACSVDYQALSGPSAEGVGTEVRNRSRSKRGNGRRPWCGPGS